MDILYLMILCSISLAVIFLIIFIVNVKKGQFEDDESPAVRMLMDDEMKVKDPKKVEDKVEDKSK